MNQQNKLKVFETFAGIGAQTKALKNINVEHEVVATSEWDINAIISYAYIHQKDEMQKFNNPTVEEAINYLNKKEVNEYLQKYILNGAELTVHLDGKYLKQIPYTKLIQEK